MMENPLLRIKRHAGVIYKYLLSFTACLFVLMGIQWFDNKRGEEITNHSYHGSWVLDGHVEQKSVKALLSFDLDNNSVWIKLTKKEILSDVNAPKTDTRLVKMNLNAFLNQTMVVASIGKLDKEGVERNGFFDTTKMLSSATYYANGHLTLIMDEEDIFGGSSNMMVFILSQDRRQYK